MKNSLKRVVSLALAIMMIFAIAAPVAMAVTETDVIVHKILMEKVDFDAHDVNKRYDPSKPMTEDEMKAFFAETATEISGIVFDFYKEGDYTGMTPNTGATPAYTYTSLKGATTGVKIPNGTYLIVENHAASTYVSADGSQLTDMKAVPQIITLPLENETGPMATVHLYPKNIEDKPIVKKTHEETDAILQMKKTAMVGTELPYVISTTIPAQAKYATATWTDQMTAGLDLVAGSITVEGAGLAAGDYTITPGADGRSFTVALTATGLGKINDQATPQTITIKYRAILNDAAVVEIPEANDVFFHYGNKDEHGNTPIPTKPDNGKITVSKSFEAGTDLPQSIEVELIDANTGLPVTKGVDGDGNEVDIVAKQILNAGNQWTYTWTNLDNDKQYKVVEVTTGYVVTYGLGQEAGTITINNKKSDNPPPVNPEEPTVTTYGKKFVKTNDGGTNLERLAGAEFVVLNEAKDAYLGLKDKTQDLTAYNAAQEAYLNAIAARNAAAAADPPATDTELAAMDANIAILKTARDNAYFALNTQWVWVTDEADAFKFVSGFEGRFEVTGLDKGTYYLKETKAPAGYALLTGEIQFIVNETSYSASIPGQLPYDTEKPMILDGQQVKNMKVTIPQTGGIGTVIFIVAGLALMGTAVIGLRKRPQED